MERKLLIILTLLFIIMLSGCKSNGEYNEYGIKEKEINSLISVLIPEVEFKINVTYKDASVRLYFLETDYIFEAHSNDGYFKNDSDLNLKGMSFAYKGDSYVDVNWECNDTKVCRAGAYLTTYFNFIIKQKERIIGYIVVKNYKTQGSQPGYLKYVTEIKKAVVFPDVLNRKNDMSYEIVNALINQENYYYEDAKNPMGISSHNHQYVTLCYTAREINIIEKNNQLMIENAFNISFPRLEFEYHIYSEDAYFLQGDKTSHYIVVDTYAGWNSQKEETFKTISIYWDCSREEEQNDIKAIAPTYIYIFIKEKNNLIGVAKIELNKYNSDFDGKYWNHYQLTINCLERYAYDIPVAYGPVPSIEQLYEFFKELERSK